MTISIKDFLNQMNSFYYNQAFYEDTLNVEYTSFKTQTIYEYSSGAKALNQLKTNASLLELSANDVACINYCLNLFGNLMRLQADLLIPKRTLENFNGNLSNTTILLSTLGDYLNEGNAVVKTYISELKKALSSIQTVIKGYTTIAALTSTIKPTDFQKIETALNSSASLIYLTINNILAGAKPQE